MKNDVKLPSRFEVGDTVHFTINLVRLPATVQGVHFYNTKVKYDLSLWLGETARNGSTRIYNVDSYFVDEPVAVIN